MPPSKLIHYRKTLSLNYLSANIQVMLVTRAKNFISLFIERLSLHNFITLWVKIPSHIVQCNIVGREKKLIFQKQFHCIALHCYKRERERDGIRNECKEHITSSTRWKSSLRNVKVFESKCFSLMCCCSSVGREINEKISFDFSESSSSNRLGSL